MTTRNPIPTRARLIAALAATGVALLAAAPANAISRGGYEPTEDDAPIERTHTAESQSGSGGCSVTLSTGQTIVYPEGYSFSVINKSTGKKHTFTCTNGAWVETVEARPPVTENHWEVDSAHFDPSRTLMLQNLHEVHAYETSEGSHAAP